MMRIDVSQLDLSLTSASLPHAPSNIHGHSLADITREAVRKAILSERERCATLCLTCPDKRVGAIFAALVRRKPIGE